jgi:uncharacterized protein (TIGR02285 family)
MVIIPNFFWEELALIRRPSAWGCLRSFFIFSMNAGGGLKKVVYVLPLLFLTVSALEARSEWIGDEKKIIWLKSNYPPYYITDGPNANTGIADRLEQLLRKELTGYEHDTLVANWRRILQMMKSGKNVVCLTFLKTPERERFIQYSILTSVKPATGICVRAGDPLFKGMESISFTDLLNKKDLKIGITHGRAYGKAIDRALKENKNARNIVVRTSSDGIDGLISLLMRKRIDALICYPHEANIVAREKNLKGKIKQLGVVEQAPLNLSYSGAPKTAWGKKVIKEINRIYRKHHVLKKTSMDLEPYLDPDTAKRFREEVAKLNQEKAAE